MYTFGIHINKLCTSLLKLRKTDISIKSVILTEYQIKEFAAQKHCRFRCFVNRQTRKLVFIPDTYKNLEMNMNTLFEENDKCEYNLDYNFEVEPLKTQDSFRMMENYTGSLDNMNKMYGKLKGELIKQKQFRNFNSEIEYSGELT